MIYFPYGTDAAREQTDPKAFQKKLQRGIARGLVVTFLLILWAIGSSIEQQANDEKYGKAKRAGASAEEE